MTMAEMVVLLLYLRRNKVYGRVTALWLMLYSLGRGLIEIVRDDPRGSVGVFSTSQFISLIMFRICPVEQSSMFARLSALLY